MICLGFQTPNFVPGFDITTYKQILASCMALRIVCDVTQEDNYITITRFESNARYLCTLM
jgi:hypothetical protein